MWRKKQRLAIAATLALQPRIMVFDEPTTDVDPMGKLEIFAVLAADYPAESSRGKLAGAGGVLNGLGVALAAVAFSQLPAIFVANGMTSTQAARYLLLSVAALSLATAIIVQFGLKGGTPGKRRARVNLLTTLRIGIAEGRRNSRLMLCYAGGFISRADLTIVATFISLWLQQAGRNEGMSGVDAIARAGMIYGIIQGSSLLWAPVCGILLDRFHRLPCMVASLLIAGIGYTFLGLQEHPFEPAGIAGAGQNWFHGTSFPRGYYLSVGVVERLPSETPGVRVERMILGHGFKTVLKEAARFSQKQLDTVVVPHGLAEQLRESALRQAGLLPGVSV